MRATLEWPRAFRDSRETQREVFMRTKTLYESVKLQLIAQTSLRHFVRQ